MGLLRSYKGLKLSPRKSLISLAIVSLLRSYKGLKLASSSMRYGRILCLLRSYNGLKLSRSPIHHVVFGFVYYVPIRD